MIQRLLHSHGAARDGFARHRAVARLLDHLLGELAIRVQRIVTALGTLLLGRSRPARRTAVQDRSQLIQVGQPAISRIEMGNTNPTVRTLGRLARGFGKKLQIKFV